MLPIWLTLLAAGTAVASPCRLKPRPSLTSSLSLASTSSLSLASSTTVLASSSSSATSLSSAISDGSSSASSTSESLATTAISTTLTSISIPTISSVPIPILSSTSTSASSTKTSSTPTSTLKSSSTPSPTTIEARALANAYKVLEGTLSDGTAHKACTKDNVAVRKEFGDLSKPERAEYIRAVKCLMKKPSKLNPTKYPGAKTRFDDFVAIHMELTPTVHNTANFLHWHRYYVWAYETALRNECDYTGYQPYWSWGKYTDLATSPIFNGDEYSMSGNGEYIAHQGENMGSEKATGGGCVKTGPFADMTVNLGPVGLGLDKVLKVPSNPRADGMGYNPRCLRRDVNNFWVRNVFRQSDINRQIQNSNNLAAFQNTLQEMHTGGHFSVNGDPGGDVYVSPAEPTFWLHHAQVDRQWWMWQNNVDTQIATRTKQYDGVTHWQNRNSAKGRLTDKQSLGVVAPAGMDGLASSELISTTSGPFCYVYV